jgi:excisionase family DNA binding protein
MTNSQIKSLLTFEETLAILKITRPTLYKIMNNNGIDVVRIGGRVLFTESAINEYIERCTVKNAVGGN